MAEDKIRNGKELLERCIRQLQERQRGDVGGNVAQYPVVVIMMGEKSAGYVKYIKNTLDDNWNNSRYIKYVKVVKCADEWKAVQIDISEDDKQCEWQTEPEDFKVVLSKAITKMLETEGIFSVTESVKMEYVLDAAEESGKEYYNLFQNTENAQNAGELKTLYLMLNQSNKNIAGTCNELLDYMMEKQTKDTETIYLLSNQLKSKRILGENRIFENYRLIADIILMGGNKEGTASFRPNLYNGFKTVSYALVTKPTAEIAEVTVQTLFAQIYENDKRAFAGHLTEKTIREMLGIDNNGGFEIGEMIFQRELEKHFPNKGSFCYLPFRSAKEGKEALSDATITDKELNQLTYGVYASFVKKYFIEPVEKLFVQKSKLREFRQQLSEKLEGMFGHFELLDMNDQRDILQRILKESYRTSGEGRKASYQDTLFNRAVAEARALFYEKLKNLYLEELERKLDAASQLEERYALCEKEIMRAMIGAGGKVESKSIEMVYTGIVKEYINTKQLINEKKTAFPDIFREENTKEDLLEAFWNVFRKMIDERQEFSYDFEREVNYRMNRMGEKGQYQLGMATLHTQLDESIRLNNIMDLEMVKKGRYYLISEKANYAKNRVQLNGENHFLFVNRTDCMEILEIYDISRPKLKQLVKGEENEDRSL